MNPRPLGYERRRHCSTLDSTTPARPARSGSAMCPPGLALRDPAGSVIFRPAARFRCKGSPHDDLLPGRSGAHGAGRACVIRNVVAGRLRPAGDPGQRAADRALPRQGPAGIATPQFPGLPAMKPPRRPRAARQRTEPRDHQPRQDADAYPGPQRRPGTQPTAARDPRRHRPGHRPGQVPGRPMTPDVRSFRPPGHA